jgi:hypothetical protein
MLYLGTKTFLVKQALRQWVKYSFTSPTLEKMKLKIQLEELQKRLENCEITNQNQKEEFKLQCSYQNVLRREEEFWRLKSHSLWLQVKTRIPNISTTKPKQTSSK